ncbi:Peptide chain release factor class I/class II [Trinorchestia longiramus]|nr:Peptide chain release factor class I/class II [Trinorchestia longiramus]
MNMTKHDLRLLVLHYFKLGHNASEASANINQAWGEESTRDRTVRRWLGKFRSGDESLKDEEGRGRLGSRENEQLHAVVEQNPRQSVREMSQTLGVSIATVLRHLKIIGKVKKLDKWVPHELNENQKLRRFEVCLMLPLRNTNDLFLDRIVTCDEKWVLYVTVNDQFDIEILQKDLKIEAFRSKGAGGQSVNTADSAVRITHLPTGTVVECQRERTQHRNKALAMARLRSILYQNERDKELEATSASRKLQLGTRGRSEKIRTYNFPQERVTDHRIGLSVHNINGVLSGEEPLQQLLVKLRHFADKESIQVLLDSDPLAPAPLTKK